MIDPVSFDLLNTSDKIGIAVSGGADSMALAHILRTTFPDKSLYAYTVDHALRPESAAEASAVHDWLSPLMEHDILRWDGAKPDSGIQEEARTARYNLLRKACREDGVGVLCLAHHKDDQAETVLHRLAKGSGLDGLGGMHIVSSFAAPAQAGVHSKDIPAFAGTTTYIVRPLLHKSHGDLVTYCMENGIAWIEDPSNENDKYARVRLRQAREVLEAEGLSNDRLARLAERMQRASDALEHYAQKEWNAHLLKGDAQRVVFNNTALRLPDELVLRLILKAADELGHGELLRANLKRLEEFYVDDNRGARISLGKLLIAIDTVKGITVERE